MATTDRSRYRQGSDPEPVVRSWFDSAPVVLPSQGRIEGSHAITDSNTATARQRPAFRDDRAIVDKVIAGDRDAFRQLVDREAASVVRACYRVLGDLHEAEDAAQEAFVTAYRSLASWRGEGSLGAWLTRIAVRIAIRQAGRRKTVAWLDVAQVADGSTGDPISASVAAASVAASDNSDPSALAARAERAADVRSAVAGLAEPYREVVVLRFFGDLSLEEIARQVDRPLGTVKTHLHRGLQRLRGSVTREVSE